MFVCPTTYGRDSNPSLWDTLLTMSAFRQSFPTASGYRRITLSGASTLLQDEKELTYSPSRGSFVKKDRHLPEEDNRTNLKPKGNHPPEKECRKRKAAHFNDPSRRYQTSRKPPN
ncbi:hypothetical protein ZHAS_00010707 [Anopheles sinensis]|uniref:Uncharacterized protein n=1 Tax=Anopheles sinensis TaxID=74873 RepID=A0A084VYI9_ANOSI|nr:hypothetical protein ZHAS_00010707 [Anopheles sinensis]